MDMPGLLDQGLLLFNEGKFYDAHEMWEDLWRITQETALKTSYQGLIQAAVGLHHLSHHNQTGARSQLQKSIRNLQTGLGAPTGLDIPNLIEQLKTVLGRMQEVESPSVSTVRIARLK